ncbi:hypothetical protein GN956_G11555 [Arapaima gigas]
MKFRLAQRTRSGNRTSLQRIATGAGYGVRNEASGCADVELERCGCAQGFESPCFRSAAVGAGLHVGESGESPRFRIRCRRTRDTDVQKRTAGLPRHLFCLLPCILSPLSSAPPPGESLTLLPRPAVIERCWQQRERERWRSHSHGAGTRGTNCHHQAMFHPASSHLET